MLRRRVKACSKHRFLYLNIITVVNLRVSFKTQGVVAIVLLSGGDKVRRNSYAHGTLSLLLMEGLMIAEDRPKVSVWLTSRHSAHCN